MADPNRYVDAALESYQQGRNDRAVWIVEVLDANPTALERLDVDRKFSLQIVQTHIALDRNQSEGLDLALQLDPVTDTQRVNALEAWGRALARQGDTVSALNALLAAKSLVLQDAHKATQTRLNGLIWQTLIQLQPAMLDEIQRMALGEDITNWVRVANLWNAALSNASWQNAWAEWQRQHPSHESTRWLAESQPQLTPEPRRIALLLPQVGDDAVTRAAHAIRDGFMVAWLEESRKLNPQNLPVVTFVDASGEDIASTIQQAFAEGATHVVGPLLKSDANDVALNAMSSSGSILMLNHPSVEVSTDQPNLRHTAFSIEDEALMVASRLRDEEHNRCALLYGNEPWMLRARAQFEEAFPDEAKLLAVHSIPDAATVTEVVGESLGVAASEARHQQLQSVVRFNVEFAPRLNQEINCVVAFIEGLQLEAILEALRYHSDRSLRVIVTESALREDIPQLAEGVIATVSPWSVYPTVLGDAVNSAFNAAPNMRTFYALGIDAYRLVNRWDELSRFKTLVGSAGQYRLADSGKITRVPIWAIVENKKLKPLTFRLSKLREHPHL